MANKLNSLNVPRIDIQDEVESIQLDDYFQTLKNKVNELIDELGAAQIGTTNAETTDARPYHTSLKDRLDSIRNGQFPYLKEGGVVTVNGSNPQKFDVTAGEASIAGVDIKWAAATSGTIVYTFANQRYDVIVLNSDSTITIATGTESTDAIYPTISDTQKAIAILKVETASITLIDCRDWGAYYLHDGQFKYKFNLTSAISDVSGDAIFVMIGNNYEELSFSSKDNIYIDGNRLKCYRKSDSFACIEFTSCDNVTVDGVQAFGNGKAGSKPLFELAGSDNVTIKNCIGDGNTLSTADGKDLDAGSCEGLIMLGNRFSSIDTSLTTFNNQMREIKVSKIEAESDVEILGFNVVGEVLNISSSTGIPTITALSSSRIAYIDSTNDDLRTYDFYGTDWTQVGNDLNISGVEFPIITALSSTRIAFIDSGNADLRTYDFDGTNWSQVGNDLNISGTSVPSLTALSSSRIAYIDAANDDLRAYDFDGTNWTQVGNDLNLGSVTNTAMAALSSTRIAFMDNNNEDLRTYDFDGTDWSQVGNDLNISLAGVPAIISLSSTRISYIDDVHDDLRVYDFDGTDWSQVGNDLNISGVVYPAITALLSTKIVFIDSINNDLTAYEIDYNLSQDPPNPAFGTL